VQLPFEIDSEAAYRGWILRGDQFVRGLSATQKEQSMEVFAGYEYGSHVIAGYLYIEHMLVRERNDQR
jgi:hypothetical protein